MPFFSTLMAISRLPEPEGGNLLSILDQASWGGYLCSSGTSYVFLFDYVAEGLKEANRVLEDFGLRIEAQFAYEGRLYKFYSIEFFTKENGDWIKMDRGQLKNFHYEVLTVQGLTDLYSDYYPK